MQLLDRLLIDALDGHRANVLTPRRFDQGCSIRCIGLVAPNVCTHVLRGQQDDLVAQRSQPPGVVVR